MKHSLCHILCLVAVIAIGSAALANDPPPITAILGAVGAEIDLIEQEIADQELQTFLGVRFTLGNLKGRRVVLAKTGVGKVNAAMTATLLIDHFQPAEVIFTGIAGGLNPDLLPGDIVIGAKTAQHDYGDYRVGGFTPSLARNPVDGKRNPLFFRPDRRLLQLAEQAAGRVRLEKVTAGVGERTPRITQGAIVTGDAFIASSSKKAELRDRFHADAVEMEGAAVAQVCYQQGTPCLVIRSLSDNADERADLDLKRFYRTAARNSATFVMALVELLAGPQARD